MRAHDISEPAEPYAVLPPAIRHKIILGNQWENFRYWPAELLAAHTLAAKKEISQKRIPYIKKHFKSQSGINAMVEQADLCESFSEEHHEETACFNDLVYPYIKALSLAHHSQLPVSVPPFESIHSFYPILRNRLDKRQQTFARLFESVIHKQKPGSGTPTKQLVTALCLIKAGIEHITRLETGILYPRAMEMENTVTRSESVPEKHR